MKRNIFSVQPGVLTGNLKNLRIGMALLILSHGLLADALAVPHDRHEKLYQWIVKECAVEEPKDAALLAQATKQFAGKIIVYNTTWHAPAIKSELAGLCAPGHTRLAGDIKPNFEYASRANFVEGGYWPHYGIVALEEIVANRFKRQVKLTNFELLALQTSLDQRIKGDPNYQKLLNNYRKPSGTTRAQEEKNKELATQALRAMEQQFVAKAREEVESITRKLDAIRLTQMQQAARWVQDLQELGFDDGARRLQLSLYTTFESQLSLWPPEKFKAVFGKDIPANRGSIIQRTIDVGTFGIVRIPSKILLSEEAGIDIHPLLGNPPVSEVKLRASDEPPLTIGKISENVKKDHRAERMDLESYLIKSRKDLQNVQRIIPDYENKLRTAQELAAQSKRAIEKQSATFLAAEAAWKKERALPPKGAEIDFRALQTVEAELRRADISADSRRSLTARQQQLQLALDAAELKDEARYERIRNLQLKVLDAAMPDRTAEGALANATIDARAAQRRLASLQAEAAAYQKEISLLESKVTAARKLASTESGSQIIDSLIVRWQDRVVYEAEQKAASGSDVFRERLKHVDAAIEESRASVDLARQHAESTTYKYVQAQHKAWAKGELLPGAIRNGSYGKAVVEAGDFLYEVFYEAFRSGGPPAALMEAVYKTFEIAVFNDGKMFSSFDEKELRESMRLQYHNAFCQVLKSKVWKIGNPAAAAESERKSGFGDPISDQRWLENTLGNPAKQLASDEVGHFLSNPKALKTSEGNAFWAHLLGVDHRFQPPERFRKTLEEMAETNEIIQDRSEIFSKGLKDTGKNFLTKIAKDAGKQLALNAVEEHLERRPWIDFLQAELDAAALFPGWVVAMQKREAVEQELTGMIQARAESLDKLDRTTGLKTKVNLPFEKAGTVEVEIALAYGLTARSIKLGDKTYEITGGKTRMDAKSLKPNAQGVLDIFLDVKDPRDDAPKPREK